MSKESVREMFLKEIGDMIPKIPKGAISVQMVANEHGISTKQAARLLNKKVEIGGWKKKQVGIRCWYWKDET